MSIDAASKNETIPYRWYVVAILDVLGQQDAIRQLARLQPSSANYSEIIRKLQDSIGKRNQMVDSFRMSLEKFTTATKRSIADPEQRAVYDRFQHRQIKTYTFGDTVVAYVPVVTPQGDVSVRDIYGILMGCAGTMLGNIADSVPIRGAIEIGYGLEWGDNEIYGPAFLSAYELEQQIAQYPRIVVGHELMLYLEQLTERPETSPTRILATQIQKLINRDEDGCFFIDYLGDGYREIKGSQDTAQLVNAGLAFAKREHLHFIQQGNAKLAGRYASLVRYYEANAPPWRCKD